MEHNDEITELIYAAIDEVNSTLSPEQVLTKSPDTAIIGGPRSLDSMGTVNFVIALEEQVERTLSATISVMDAITVENTQWTVAAVGKYIEEQLDRLQGGRGRAQASARQAPSTSLQ